MSSESSLDPHVEDIINEQYAGAPKLTGPLTRFNATVARYVHVCRGRRPARASSRSSFYQVFGRYVLNNTPTWAESLALVLVLYVTMLGAAVGVRDAGHIGMESLLVLLPDALRDRIELVIHVLVAAVRRCHGLERLGARQVGRWTTRSRTLGLPEAMRYVPLVALGHPDRAVLDRAHHRAAARRGGRAVMALTILAVTFFGLPDPGRAGRLRDRPVGARAPSSTRACRVAVIFQQMMSGMNIFSFLAIPFFIFAGELMLYGGIADKIVAFAKSLVGHIRGGLGMSNVVACTLFGGVSGSPVADVSAMGAVMIPMMKKEGYHADYAVNVTTHAALVGALMPTSHNMIIYALAAGGKVSIAALILAGMVPARC